MALFSRLTRDDATGAEAQEDRDPHEAAPIRGRGIGIVLREARQNFGRDIPQIGAALRIRPEYLQAIEAGQYQRLPGPTYAIGFIRTYSEYLGLDGAEMVRRFKQETEGIELKRDLSFPMPLTERSMPGGTILLVALILAICGYGIWYYVSSTEKAKPERVGAVPPTLLAPAGEATATLTAPGLASIRTPNEAAAALPISPTGAQSSAQPLGSIPTPPESPSRAATPALPPPTPMPTAAAQPVPTSSLPAPSPLPTPVPPPASAPATVAGLPPVPAASAAPTDSAHVFGITNGPARIVVRATADSWIQVHDAQESQVFTRVMRAGDVYRVPDKTGLAMRTGNAGGLEVSVDGKLVPTLGGIGLIRRNILLDPQKLIAGTAIQE